MAQLPYRQGRLCDDKQEQQKLMQVVLLALAYTSTGRQNRRPSPPNIASPPIPIRSAAGRSWNAEGDEGNGGSYMYTKKAEDKWDTLGRVLLATTSDIANDKFSGHKI